MTIQMDDDASRRMNGPMYHTGNLDCDLFTYLCWAIVWCNGGAGPIHADHESAWKMIEVEVNRNIKAGYW